MAQSKTLTGVIQNKPTSQKITVTMVKLAQFSLIIV